VCRAGEQCSSVSKDSQHILKQSRLEFRDGVHKAM
jgi:hypothetical protein